MPFRQPQYIQHMHHGLIAFVLLCVTVLFTDNTRCRFTIMQYSFLVAVLVVMLIAHIFCSDWIDYTDVSPTVLQFLGVMARMDTA